MALDIRRLWSQQLEHGGLAFSRGTAVDAEITKFHVESAQ